MGERRYCWTHYQVDTLPKYDETLHGYLIYQLEVGEEKKVPHWQGYVELKKTMRYKAMFKSLGLGHEGKIIKARGTAAENKAYCSDPKKRHPEWKVEPGFMEYGAPTVQGQRNDLKSAIDTLLKDGIDAVKQQHASVYVRYWKGLEKLIEPKRIDEPRANKPYVTWVYGPPGSGKSYHAEQFALENKYEYYIYNKSFNGFWQRYNQQKVLIIDDIRVDTFKFDELLRILDRYQYLINQKQGDRFINSPFIYITAPVPPETMFPSDDGEKDLRQLTRRIDCIIKVEPRDEPVSQPIRYSMKNGKLTRVA
jgi:hypothetical protein